MFSFSKLIVYLAVAVAVMVAIKDGRVLASTGIVGRCNVVNGPQGDTATWEACRAGKLEGRPSLVRKSCTSAGVVENVEYWRCPTRVESSRT
jgi:hypothetical protein